jgi:hypothetical protein
MTLEIEFNKEKEREAFVKLKNEISFHLVQKIEK